MVEPTEREKLLDEAHQVRRAAAILPLFDADGLNPEWWDHMMRARALEARAKGLGAGSG
ncbi:hypothetical protein LCGC14_0820520 [marine sediment metagenome]|uniref:Uncharacterized protein n=1 Tax=marine sediment metagenome TaxID=412755 RepID=A0A0F9PNM8_9ZZZZ